jgi:RHH-type rel operon transcriptional repressor/antitoxin RelB
LSDVWPIWPPRPAVPRVFYAREAILEHLEELEDAYLAEERLKQPGKRWTQAELEADIDLER